jgi:hypothetical protein
MHFNRGNAKGLKREKSGSSLFSMTESTKNQPQRTQRAQETILFFHAFFAFPAVK